MQTPQYVNSVGKQSFPQAVCSLFKQHGVKCFWSGTGARSVRVGMATGIHFATVSALKQAYGYDYSKLFADTQFLTVSCPVEPYVSHLCSAIHRHIAIVILRFALL